MQRLVSATLILLASYAVATGPVVLWHNSDSLIPVFASLEIWTPFYWGQDRFGMFLPLLALPIRDGFWNLIAQNTLSTAFFVAGSAAFAARCQLARPTAWALGLLAALLLFDANLIPLLLFTTNQSYAPALGLFGLAIYFLSRESRPGWVSALALSILGTWTNAGVALLAVCLAITMALAGLERRTAGRVLVLAIAGLVAHRGFQALTPGPLLDVTTLTVPPLTAIPGMLWAFGVDGVAVIGRPFFLVTALLWLLACWSSIGQHDGRVLRLTMLAALVGVAFYWLVMALFFRGVGRHIAPTIPVLIVVPTLVLARSVPQAGRIPIVPLGLLILAAIVAQTGVDWPENVRRRVLSALGQGREETLYAKGVVAVTGDYWDVWPLTFATNMLHERATGERPVLPVTMRSDRLVEERDSVFVVGARVAVIPSGDVGYWNAGPNRPALRPEADFGTYGLAYIAPRP